MLASMADMATAESQRCFATTVGKSTTSGLNVFGGVKGSEFQENSPNAVDCGSMMVLASGFVRAGQVMYGPMISSWAGRMMAKPIEC